LKAPLMVLQADREGDPMQLAKLHSTGPGGAFYNVKLLRSGHANFTDLPFISPLHWVTGLSGSIDQTEAERTINAYTLSFFNKYLKATKDEPSALQFKSAKCVVMPN
jgi:hypothetical protein